MHRSINLYVVAVAAFFVLLFLYVYRIKHASCDNRLHRIISYGSVNEHSHFIFIGGVPQSGATLLRAMLNAHPEVQCDEEIPVIPLILKARSTWKEDDEEWDRLQHARVTDEVLKSAIGSFIVKVTGHRSSAPRLCKKDPFTMKYASYISQMFPNAQYIFLIRDGRATVHSIISREINITDFCTNNYLQCMTKWNEVIGIMDKECTAVGDKCLKVYYEQLVLHPESQMRRILDFLGLPWDDSVLHHEQYIGKDISLSEEETSSDQVVEPINLDGLTKWVGAFPKGYMDEIDVIAPMLRKLGYDPTANPPNYGKPDDVVKKNKGAVNRSG